MTVPQEVQEYVRANPSALGVVGLDPDDVPLSKAEILRLVQVNASTRGVSERQVIEELESSMSTGESQ